MSYDFDNVIERKGTNCFKWDYVEEIFGESELLPMWVADMDFKSPEQVVKAIENRAKHGVFGYTARPDTLYNSIIDWLEKRFNWKVKKDWILFTPGVVPAIDLSIQAFTSTNDSVIIQPPVYHPFFGAVENNKRKLVGNPLKFEDGKYRIDFEDLENKINSGTRMLILCSPHNPVGRVWDEDELSKLGFLAKKHGLLIISDEIHADIVYKPNKHTPFLNVDKRFEEFSIVCMAPSKTFNLAGLETSFVIVKNRLLREKFEEHIKKNSLWMTNIFGMVAAEAAYKFGEEWLDDLLNYLSGNIKYIESFVEERLPEVKFNRPEGTYLAWLDFRGLGLSDEELKKLLIKKGKIGLNYGPDFGEEGKGFQRLNFGCPRGLLKDGLERIETAINS
ncbi:MAG: pyridoxal phosphate-dependent aminotransferase [Kosmotoga sp.]|nr:MAG: pyridoxal phosphate-dependent aminotransferase [Kosmotoga sp.]